MDADHHPGFGGDLTYAEGFAGPGFYKDDSPGSPVIALRALLDHKDLKYVVSRVRLLFVDKDPRCTRHLEQRLRAAVGGMSLEKLRDHKIHVDVVTGSCEPELEGLLTRHGAWGRPMLVVLDTWGGSVPLDLVRRVAGNPAGEVIITMKPQYFARFSGTEDIDHGDRVFGGTSWRRVAEQAPRDKARWLLQHYRETVQDAGFAHVLDFELIDKYGHALYLVYGTNHRKGLQKMKEAMWEVDVATGGGYRDPRDPKQETLDIQDEPQTAPLRRLLHAHLAALPGRQAAVEELRRYALYYTVYKESQVTPVVRDMLQRGELTQADPGRSVARNTIVRLP